MKSLSCKDMGMESCDFVTKGETTEEVMQKSQEHGQAAHADKMAEMKAKMTDDQMAEMMKNAVKTM